MSSVPVDSTESPERELLSGWVVDRLRDTLDVLSPALGASSRTVGCRQGEEHVVERREWFYWTLRASKSHGNPVNSV